MPAAGSRLRTKAHAHETALVALPEILSAGGGDQHGHCPQHDHPGDELVLVESGTVRVTSGEAVFDGVPGTLFLFPRGVFHDQDNPPGARSWHVVFRCRGRAFPREPRAVLLAADDPARLWVPQLARGHLDPGGVPRTNALLLLAVLERLGALAEQQALPSALAAAVRHLEAHPAEEVLAADLAQSAGVSQGHLRTLFRKHLGLTPQEHHEQLRLDLAAKLLRSSYLSMADVAGAIGWSDANYFARRFAKRFGKRPRAWRVEHRA